MGERVGGWVGEWFPTAAIIRLSQPSLAGVGAEISNNFNEFWYTWNYSSYKSFLDPKRYYGRGTYALTKVQKISGTEGYIDLAIPGRRGLCQNVKSFQDCLMEDYIERGLELCKCIPLYLRYFYKQVKNTQSHGFQRLWYSYWEILTVNQ